MGFLRPEQGKEGTWRVSHVGTLPEYQRKGLAQAILNTIFSVAKQRCNAKELVLTTSTMQQPAINLYEKNGFKLVQTTPLLFGLQKVEFLKPLSANP